MATTLSGEVFISDDYGQTFEQQTIPDFTNPLEYLTPSLLARDESNAFVYTVNGNCFRATITNA